MNTDSQCVDRNSELAGQFAAIDGFAASAVVVVTDHQASSVCRQLGKTLSEAIQLRFEKLGFPLRQDRRLDGSAVSYRFLQALLRSPMFEQQVVSDAVEVRHDVRRAYLLASFETVGNSVKNLIGEGGGVRAVTPFEVAHQLQADELVLVSRCSSIGGQREEKLFERRGFHAMMLSSRLYEAGPTTFMKLQCRRTPRTRWAGFPSGSASEWSSVEGVEIHLTFTMIEIIPEIGSAS